MEPENEPLEEEIPNLETIIFRFHASFRGGGVCFLVGGVQHLWLGQKSSLIIKLRPHSNLLIWFEIGEELLITTSSISSWWFQPIGKICSSNWIISRGENKKHLKPPPSFACSPVPVTVACLKVYRNPQALKCDNHGGHWETEKQGENIWTYCWWKKSCAPVKNTWLIAPFCWPVRFGNDGKCQYTHHTIQGN